MKYESQYYGVVQMEDIIEHHGIKGMKWGIRRYQNPDGSLTDEGKRRYGVRSVEEYKAKKYASKPYYTIAGNNKVRDYLLKNRESDDHTNDEQILVNMRKKSRSEYYKAIDTLIDTTTIKDKKKKLEFEGKLLDINNSDRDPTDSYMDQLALGLMGRVNQKSGDYYNGIARTKTFKAGYDKEMRLREQFSDMNDRFRRDYPDYKERSAAEKKDPKFQKVIKDLNKAEDELNGIVLRDIGYEDTPEHRKKTSILLRWD